MSRYDEAKSIDDQGGRNDVIDLVDRCLESRTQDDLAVVRVLAQNMYGGHTYNFELKIIAALALVAWGVRGLETLADMARESPESKNNSIALQILVTLASGSALPELDKYVPSPLATTIRAAVPEWDELFREAGPILRRFVIDLDESDAQLALGLGLMTSMLNPEMTPVLYRAFASRWLAVGQTTIAEFSRLIDERPDDESAFQGFFSTHPVLLEPDVYEIWPKPDLQGAAEPDFVVRHRDNRYTIIEIKTPSARIGTQRGHLSAVATEAVEQVRRYQETMAGQVDKMRNFFPSFSRPHAAVVLGLEESLSEQAREALRRENASRAGVRIVGFDALLARAKTIHNNVVQADIPASRIRVS